MWGLVLSALTIAVSFLTESGREDRMNSRQGGGGGGGRAAAASRGWLSLANGISRDALTSRLLSDRVFVSGACELDHCIAGFVLEASHCCLLPRFSVSVGPRSLSLLGLSFEAVQGRGTFQATSSGLVVLGEARTSSFPRPCVASPTGNVASL
jgi:hypothetical protein